MFDACPTESVTLLGLRLLAESWPQSFREIIVKALNNSEIATREILKKNTFAITIGLDKKNQNISMKRVGDAFQIRLPYSQACEDADAAAADLCGKLKAVAAEIPNARPKEPAKVNAGNFYFPESWNRTYRNALIDAFVFMEENSENNRYFKKFFDANEEIHITEKLEAACIIKENEKYRVKLPHSWLRDDQDDIGATESGRRLAEQIGKMLASRESLSEYATISGQGRTIPMGWPEVCKEIIGDNKRGVFAYIGQFHSEVEGNLGVFDEKPVHVYFVENGNDRKIYKGRDHYGVKLPYEQSLEYPADTVRYVGDKLAAIAKPKLQSILEHEPLLLRENNADYGTLHALPRNPSVFEEADTSQCCGYICFSWGSR